MYLLDTCICIDFMRGKLPYAYDILQKSDSSMFKIPAIVAAELYYGAAKSSSPVNAHWSVEKFLSSFDIVPFDSLCTYSYGKIRAELEKRGAVIGHNDLFIAATALANQAILVTNNANEFKRVPGLSIESWYEVDMKELLAQPEPSLHPLR